MNYHSSIPNLIKAIEQFIPNSERANIANLANECLEETLNLTVWLNQLTATCPHDLGDAEFIATNQNYLNLALTEIGHKANELKNNSQLKAKFANRAKLTTIPIDKAKGGVE